MSEELVTIATSGDVVEAEFLRNHLEDAGYEAYVADNNIISADFFLAPAVGWVKIKVPQSQAQKAAEFVEKLRNVEIIYDGNFPES